MRHERGKVSDIVIAYIGGGSRDWASKLMVDLAVEESLSGTVRLYDIDQAAAKDNELIGNSLKERDDVKGQWDYFTVPSLEQALDGADFVVISILPGTFDEMESDVHYPEQYGIYQSVGDTVGPGGIVRALRTLPLFQGFARAIEKHCPDAWVINYTNPMALCTQMLFSTFPKIKAFGCCHEVFGTQELLAQMLSDTLNVENVEREEIKTNVLGINHFTWLDQATYQGMDLFPLYRDFAQKYYESGFEWGPEEKSWRNDVFKGANRVKFDLFLRYGLIAAAGDRHLAEFLPMDYLSEPSEPEQWMFRLTPVSLRRTKREAINAQRRRLIAGEEQLQLKRSSEEGVRQIKALLGLGDLVSNVNLPNRGQQAGIMDNAIVETNAVFRFNSIKPVVAGGLPLPILSLVNRHVSNQELVLESILTKDITFAFQAFQNDPMVRISRAKAAELFNQMLQNTQAYLPDWLEV